ncbi:GNAT family N-acetyltransferase [Glycomyces harbinensis]|uniref:N-acetyltransferase domain-containing protein n=1 Tax=Glycomyces harbinensis TaxID=58114 RepID=A0A1G7DNX3_9ACTN|nr:GNAT family N-acetyltransferase [Glycomyces harbinensis]SDE53191.1 hypothetical protein SAMN05216270_1277 [Glycomyces harbinensis]
MAILLHRPEVHELGQALAALRDWQDDHAGMQLHPGDLGWFWRFGPESTAAAVRTWSRDGDILAVGLLDGPGLLRMTIAPGARRDEALARQITADVADADRGVLPPGKAYIEAPSTAVLQDVLAADGWDTDEPWTPLRRDFAEPVEDPGVRIEIVGPEFVADRVDLQVAAFEGSTFNAERWHAMAAGPAYADARCLVAYDDRDNAVATVTVWSAGPGRPGLIEPLGAHHDFRGHGHGRAITVAGAAALRDMGSSSAIVCTPTSNAAGVGAYKSAGFRPLPEVRDRRRDA